MQRGSRSNRKLQHKDEALGTTKRPSDIPFNPPLARRKLVLSGTLSNSLVLLKREQLLEIYQIPVVLHWLLFSSLSRSDTQYDPRIPLTVNRRYTLRAIEGSLGFEGKGNRQAAGSTKDATRAVVALPFPMRRC